MMNNLAHGNKKRWLYPAMIVIVVILGYGIGPTRLPLCGEEACRAQHGIEMAQSGNWLIATNQGVEILDRPPLQYWMLGVVHKWIHPLDPFTARMTMAVVTLLTSLIIWWYASRFLSGVGAFLAAVAYPTLGHVFDLGRRVETDGLFTMFLAAALLIWHMGYMQKWKYVWIWTLSMAIAALATLTKGSQAPIAFFGTVYLYLVLRRDFKCMFHWSHVLGIAVFIGLIATWQVPFYMIRGWEGTRLTWLTPYTSRMDSNFFSFLKHLIVFPFIVFGATLPWSALLIGLTDKHFWKMDNNIRSVTSFILIGMGTIFVPVWIAPGGHQRYLMPMHALLAILCGIVVHQCQLLNIAESLRNYWRGYLRTMGFVFVGFAAFLLAVSVAASFMDFTWIQELSQPWLQLVLLLVCSIGGMLLINTQTSPGHSENGILLTFTVASLLAICFNGPIHNAQAKYAIRLGPELADFRNTLTEGTELVSFEILHHSFIYHYGSPIPILEKPETADDVPDSVEFFALFEKYGKALEMPFKWEKVAEFNMARSTTQKPVKKIIIGRNIQN
jgi:4-amino-4-deoxy-L-arabinose transferase-like glycosyltransferase